jgi:hypothetical protein
MLTVDQFPKGRPPISEATFEAALARAIERLGGYSRHMNDAIPGLPDRYIQGGRWAELKSITFKRDVAFGSGLEKEQKRQMTVLSDAGDEVFYVALVQHDVGEKFIWCVNWSQRVEYEGRRFTLADLRPNPIYNAAGLEEIARRLLWKS